VEVRAPTYWRLALASLLTLQAAIIGLKGFCLTTSAIRFERPISPQDVVLSLSGDSLVVLAMLLLLYLFRTGEMWLEASRAGRVIALLCATACTIVCVVSVILSAFYLLCGYVFWEWGAFIESRDLLLARQAQVSDEIGDYLTDPKMLGPGLAFAALLGSQAWLTRRLRPPRFRRVAQSSLLILTALLSLGAWGPLRSRYAFDLSVPSPLALCTLPAPEVSLGLDRRFRVDDPDFSLPGPRPVPREFSRYRGAARDMNVILLVLESVRKSNVSVYGYGRRTMPELERLAGNSLVFENAYVTQPRSAKTVESVFLGTYPDLRLDCLTWHENRMKGHESFFSILKERGYSLYYGITAPRNVDGTEVFLNAVTGDRMDRAVGVEQLGRRAKPKGTNGDDGVLVEDFLSWFAACKGRAAAMIWFFAAHAPYRSLRRPFPESTLVDQYDNCLYAADVAIGQLVQGLRDLGREQDTLLLVMGDHGEMLGEHGDTLHGSFLYDGSMRIPCLLHNPSLFHARQNLAQAFQVKDIPATFFYLLGIERDLRQSENVFAKTPEDTIYLSNVMQDYKLGMVKGDLKFVLCPYRNRSYVFDRAVDPEESHNLAASLSPSSIDAMRREVLQWYFYQVDYVDRTFPALGDLPMIIPANPQLSFWVEPPTVRPGEEILLRFESGSPAQPLLVLLVEVNDRRHVSVVARGHFDRDGRWTLRARAPDLKASTKVALRGFCLDQDKKLQATTIEHLSLSPGE